MSKQNIEVTTWIRDRDGWVGGFANEYRYQAKVYDGDSDDYGINGGRVSKLEIWPKDGTCRESIVRYDRGWDITPNDGYNTMVYEAVLAAMENYQERK